VWCEQILIFKIIARLIDKCEWEFHLFFNLYLQPINYRELLFEINMQEAKSRAWIVSLFKKSLVRDIGVSIFIKNCRVKCRIVFIVKGRENLFYIFALSWQQEFRFNTCNWEELLICICGMLIVCIFFLLKQDYLLAYHNNNLLETFFETIVSYIVRILRTSLQKFTSRENQNTFYFHS